MPLTWIALASSIAENNYNYSVRRSYKLARSVSITTRSESYQNRKPGLSSSSFEEKVRLKKKDGKEK